MVEFTGVVTSAFASYGIINEEIYFDYQVVKGELPTLDSKVHGIVEVRDDDSQHATLVQLEDDMQFQRSEVSGPLHKIEKDLGFVQVKGDHGENENIPFQLSICSPQPKLGDMLKVELQEFNGVLIGSSVSFVRKRKFTAYVLKVSPCVCMLEDATYFTRDVCVKGYNPQPNDIVCGFAVECKFKEYVWRATDISPSSSTLYTLRSPLTLYKLPTFFLNSITRECSRGNSGNGVSCQPHALRIGHFNPGDSEEIQFTLSNTYPKFPVEVQCIMGSDMSILKCHDNLPIRIPPATSHNIILTFTNADMGQHVTTITFQLSVLGRKLCISRKLHVNVIEPRMGQCLRVRLDRQFLEGCQVIPGLRPERKNPRFYPNHFPSYGIPGDITSETDDELMLLDLSINNYKYIMHKLLYMEEKFVEDEMRNYSIYETSLMKRGKYLVLKVPAMVESKLNLLIGSHVLLEHPGSAIKYEGYIHKVDEVNEEVFLGFDEAYHSSYEAEYVNIHFTHSRTSFVRCHLAVDYILKTGADIMFPKSVTVKPPHFNISRLTLFNTDLNKEQVAAVRHIIEAKARPLPYLLFGPPGTGKTVTVVEAILQLYHLQSDSRILVAAPSNSACDLIATRLLSHQHTLDIVRLNSMSRYTDNLPEALQKISLSADEVKEASLKRIIVATCITAGNLYKLSLRTSHFTHVFIDEAGQAIEPEVVLPIALSTGPGTQAVLAGDPYQLGPVIRNPQCEELGLQMSLLERLMDLCIYDRNEQFPDNNYYDPILLTKLVRNYRSHPALLTIPSRLFYSNELVACGPHHLVTRAVTGHVTLPNPRVPLIFHGIRGEEMRESNNPSLYNPTEILRVLTYIKELTKSECFTAEDIGVITPYKKQAEKTRMMIQSVKDLSTRSIKVASVEDFQGQERPVIIISTVRSNAAVFSSTDSNRLLGFLQNPKRFNVAITRAQALLVIVGNPDVLKHDVQWGALLRHAQEMGCYVGCDFSDV